MATVPNTCKAGVVVNPGPSFHVEIQDVVVPEPGPGELLVRLNVTGICHSDISIMSGTTGTLLDSKHIRTAGHEGAGVVVKLGPGVQDWKIGDRAGIKPILDVCGTCELCLDGMENYCSKMVITGIQSPGTFQQYVTSPAWYTTRIPDGVPDHIAAPLMCGGWTAYGSLKRSGLKAGNWVVIPGGGGGVGIQAVQIAKIMGFRPVVVDTGDSRKRLSEKVGAEGFVDFRTAPNVAEEVKKLCDGLGAHGVVVSSTAAYKDAISYLGDRIGGRIMCIALSATDPIVGATPGQYIFRNLTISGTAVGTNLDCDQVLKFAEQGLLQAVCEVRPLRMLPDSVEQLHRGDAVGRIVIDFNAL